VGSSKAAPPSNDRPRMILSSSLPSERAGLLCGDMVANVGVSATGETVSIRVGVADGKDIGLSKIGIVGEKLGEVKGD